MSLAAWTRQAGLARSLCFGRHRTGPVRATLVLTERCHLRCDFCRLWEDPAAGVDVGEWSRLCVANPSLRWVNLSGGEVLAKEGLAELIEALKVSLPRLALLDFPTAGQTPRHTEELVRATLEGARFRLVVSVSVDGAPAWHDRLRGVEGAFDRAIDTYLRLRPLQGSGFAVRLGCTLTADAREQVAGLREVLPERIPGFSEAELHFNLAHHSSHYYRNEAFGELPGDAALEILEQRPRAFGAIGWVEWIYARLARRSLSEGFPAVGCGGLRSTVFVAPDLTVYPCSIWDAPLGNARDHGYQLAPLLATPHGRELRLKIEAHQCPGCFTPCEALPAILARPVGNTLLALREAGR
jgi:MoaA/NifB/PqqE/SkfB family radical SAM enzyme